VGNGGPNLISSFHVIGEIFDTVYTEAAMGGNAARNVQTTLVPAGGAAIVEMKMDVPGRFLLVDHAISRAMDKGALGAIEVIGPEQPGIFKTLVPGSHGTGGH
jgi:nitrite reductase (NO-forming)